MKQFNSKNSIIYLRALPSSSLVNSLTDRFAPQKKTTTMKTVKITQTKTEVRKKKKTVKITQTKTEVSAEMSSRCSLPRG